MAVDQIVKLFTSNHPLTVKFNQYLIEAYNSRPESDERSGIISNLCEENLDICIDHFGPESIYLVRPLYTLFTAQLHNEGD